MRSIRHRRDRRDRFAEAIVLPTFARRFRHTVARVPRLQSTLIPGATSEIEWVGDRIVSISAMSETDAIAVLRNINRPMEVDLANPDFETIVTLLGKSGFVCSPRDNKLIFAKGQSSPRTAEWALRIRTAAIKNHRLRIAERAVPWLQNLLTKKTEYSGDFYVSEHGLMPSMYSVECGDRQQVVSSHDFTHSWHTHPTNEHALLLWPSAEDLVNTITFFRRIRSNWVLSKEGAWVHWLHPVLRAHLEKHDAGEQCEKLLLRHAKRVEHLCFRPDLEKATRGPITRDLIDNPRLARTWMDFVQAPISEMRGDRRGLPDVPMICVRLVRWGETVRVD